MIVDDNQASIIILILDVFLKEPSLSFKMKWILKVLKVTLDFLNAGFYNMRSR